GELVGEALHARVVGHGGAGGPASGVEARAEFGERGEGFGETVAEGLGDGEGAAGAADGFALHRVPEHLAPARLRRGDAGEAGESGEDGAGSWGGGAVEVGGVVVEGDGGDLVGDGAGAAGL